MGDKNAFKEGIAGLGAVLDAIGIAENSGLKGEEKLTKANELLKENKEIVLPAWASDPEVLKSGVSLIVSIINIFFVKKNPFLVFGLSQQIYDIATKVGIIKI